MLGLWPDVCNFVFETFWIKKCGIDNIYIELEMEWTGQGMTLL